MKKMRSLFLVLILALGFCGRRAEGQTIYQTMEFSIICQYTTNFLTTTNPVTGLVTNYIHPQTVLINSANIAKAIAIDLLSTNWTRWSGANLDYEVNLATGNQGIFMRVDGKQTNVSSYFGNSFSNFFSYGASNVFLGTNYAESLPLGGDENDQDGPTTFTNSHYYGNLAYLTITNGNMSFDLFGISQGPVVNASGVLDGTRYSRYLPSGQIIAAGTFKLNVSTNVYLVPTTNGTPSFVSGVVHGNVFVQMPHFIPLTSAEGGP